MPLTVAEQQRVAQLADLVAEIDPTAAPQLQFVCRAMDGIHRPGQSLGVLASAFNPPTVAHVAMTSLAQARFRLDEILLELSVVNVDKSVFGAGLAHRCWLLEHLVQSHTGWSVGLGSHARFVDKARGILAAYPPDTNLYFIVGFDTLQRIFDRKYYRDMAAELEALFATAQLIACNRGEVTSQDLERWLEDSEFRRFRQRIHILPLPDPLPGLSSTQARRLLRAGQEVESIPSGLLPLIHRAGLYRDM